MNNGEDCPRCLGWTFDDEPCKSMLCQGIAEGRRLERAALVPLLRRAIALAERAAARTTGFRGDPGPDYGDHPRRREDDFDNDDQYEEDIDELSRLADMAERGEHEDPAND